MAAIFLISIVVVCAIAALIWCFCCRRPGRNCCYGNEDEVVPILGEGQAGRNEDRLDGDDAVERGGREGERNSPVERVKFPVQVSEDEEESSVS